MNVTPYDFLLSVDDQAGDGLGSDDVSGSDVLPETQHTYNQDYMVYETMTESETKHCKNRNQLWNNSLSVF